MLVATWSPISVAPKPTDELQRVESHRALLIAYLNLQLALRQHLGAEVKAILGRSDISYDERLILVADLIAEDDKKRGVCPTQLPS